LEQRIKLCQRFPTFGAQSVRRVQNFRDAPLFVEGWEGDFEFRKFVLCDPLDGGARSKLFNLFSKTKHGV